MTSLVSPRICCFYLHHRTGMGQSATDSFLFVDQGLPFPELWGFGCNLQHLYMYIHRYVQTVLYAGRFLCIPKVLIAAIVSQRHYE